MQKTAIFCMIFLILFGGLCVGKFTDLWMKHEKMTHFPELGEGIGVYFYGVEIHDRVKTRDIMKYEYGFLALGFISFLSAGLCYAYGRTK